MSYIFSETKGLTPDEKLSVVAKLKSSIAHVEAAEPLELGETQVVIAGEMYEQGDVEQVLPIVGSTHTLTIAFDDFAVSFATAFLEYGAISEAMDSAYVLRSQVSRYAKRHDLRLSGFVKVELLDRLMISFHGHVALGEMGEEQFKKTLSQRLLLSGKQVVLSRP